MNADQQKNKAVNCTRRTVTSSLLFSPMLITGCNQPLKKGTAAEPERSYIRYSELPTLLGAKYANAKSPVVGTADGIEVVHLCGFTCHPCFRFESNVSRWLAANLHRVRYTRSAPPLNRSWVNPARLFYALELHGLLDKMYAPVAQMAQVDSTLVTDLKKAAQRIKFLDPRVDEQKFLDSMNSFAVNQKLHLSEQLAVSAGVSAIPSVIIAGKYITSPTMNKNRVKLIEVIEELVTRESG